MKSLLLCSFYVFSSGVSSISQLLVLWGKNYTITAASLGAFGALLPWLTRTRSWAPTVLVAYSRWFRAVTLYFLLFLQVFILVSFTGVIRRVGRSSFFRLGDYFLTFFLIRNHSMTILIHLNPLFFSSACQLQDTNFSTNNQHELRQLLPFKGSLLSDLVPLAPTLPQWLPLTFLPKLPARRLLLELQSSQILTGESGTVLTSTPGESPPTKSKA